VAADPPPVVIVAIVATAMRRSVDDERTLSRTNAVAFFDDCGNVVATN